MAPHKGSSKRGKNRRSRKKLTRAKQEKPGSFAADAHDDVGFKSRFSLVQAVVCAAGQRQLPPAASASRVRGAKSMNRIYVLVAGFAVGVRWRVRLVRGFPFGPVPGVMVPWVRRLVLLLLHCEYGGVVAARVFILLGHL